MSGIQTIGELVDNARARLPADVWDYVVGGAGTEATVRCNSAALDAVVFRPRVLRDVRARDISARFLGIPLALPVLLAPIGNIAVFDPAGAVAAARAAHAAGTAAVVGMLSAPRLEEVASASDGPLVFQLHVRTDHGWMRELVARAETAGYTAICATADCPVPGRRDRDLCNGIDRSERQARPNVGETAVYGESQAAATWSDLEWLRSETRLPLVLKGVTDVEDARRAAELGLDAICVSNHGGRQLDHQVATMRALPPIAEAVGGHMDVAVDGGFMHGADVVKALALGADAVLIGRLQCLALAAGGAAALVRALEILAEEIGITLALLGAANVAAVTAEHVLSTQSVATALVPPDTGGVTV